MTKAAAYQWVDAAGDPLVRPRAGGYAMPSYRAADRVSEDLHGWLPGLRDADDELHFERGTITSRARDLVRNNPMAAGFVRREVDTVIGSQFRLSAKPDWKALGADEVWAGEFTEAMEALWRSWADDPRCYADDTRCEHFSSLLGLAYRSEVEAGDGLGIVHWRPDRPFATTVHVADPDLLQNPRGQSLNSREWRDGVRVDSHGAAIGYNFRSRHPNSLRAGMGNLEDIRFPRETRHGRPVVVHYFDRQRPGQTRGVSKLAPLIASLKMVDAYRNAELSAALLNATLAAYIKSPMDHDQLADMTTTSAYQDGRKEYHDSKSISAAGAKLMTLFPGEDVGMVDSVRPNVSFEGFKRALDRDIAAGSGQLYEQLSADYSQATYSSVRAGLIDFWRGVNVSRRSFGTRFVRPIYGAVMEEAFSRNMLPLPRNAPDFHGHFAAYTGSRWLSDGRGFVDPVKEVQAAALRINLGLSTLEAEANELAGADYRENMMQIQREIEAMPRGVLHPAQAEFAALIGAPPGLAGGMEE